jgi:hypothetical protein
MAIKPEAALYKRIRENLPDSHITRIESRVNLGIPDCLVALKGLGLFVMIELKVVKRGRKINLSPHQVAFHAKHADLGAPTFILVQYHPPGTTSALKAELLLYRGRQVLDLHHLGIDAEPVERWPLSHVLWHMLRHRLAEA